jgi:glycosyl transferase, family 25
LLDAFDQVSVINLENRPDRRRDFTDQLSQIGFAFGSRVGFFPAVGPTTAAGFRSAGVHGCFMSHLGVLRKARSDGASSILILEDDVNFARTFLEFAPRLRASLNGMQWALFYGGYSIVSAGGLNRTTRVGPGLRSAPTDVSILLGHFVAFRGSAIAETIEYLEKMLTRAPGHPEGGPMDVDGAYNWYRKSHPSAVTLLADPQLGYQRASPSSIAKSRWFDRVPVLSRIASMARVVKNRLN